jgi:hypothetical protein
MFSGDIFPLAVRIVWGIELQAGFPGFSYFSFMVGVNRFSTDMIRFYRVARRRFRLAILYGNNTSSAGHMLMARLYSISADGVVVP